MIGEILYTLFIWPINFILEFLFVLFIRIFDAPGLAIIFLSVVVNTLTLPIYNIADRWQKEERELQKRMKTKLVSIKSVFKGDERQMIINAYYRQMGYSQVLILKASLGLLLQIPFFIAAYQFLTKTKLLSGATFYFIKNLNVPDALLSLPFSFFGLTALNVLPFVMTILNIVSSFIYARDLGKREKIQLFAMAFIFLVFLYNSPSGLVLYWTMNNLYSLFKNAAQTYLKKPARVLKAASVFVSVAFVYMIWSGGARVERYTLLFIGIALSFAIIPFAWSVFIKQISRSAFLHGTGIGFKETNNLFYSAMVLLFLLLGFLNPLQVLSSSVSDFENPWLFLFRTLLQGISFLVLIPLSINKLSPIHIKRVLSLLLSFISLGAIICYFVLSANYGIMDRNFKLDDTNKLLHAFPLWANAAAMIAAAGFIALAVALKKIKLLADFFKIACAAVMLLAIIDFFRLGSNYLDHKKLVTSDAAQSSEEPVYFQLSKTEPNVFIVFMDRAQGSAMLDALEYMPSLKEELDGFEFYPNTLSFANNTVMGVPAMLGGYDYTPDVINSRENELLVDKVNEALTLMPRLFGGAGYMVNVTDPVISNMQSVPDISIYYNLPNVKAHLLSGKLSKRYYSEFSDETEEGSSFDFDILFRFGIFRAAPPALRYGIYYKGQWWREAAYNSYGRAVAEFSSLYYLPDICSLDSTVPTLNIMMNAVTHEGGAYAADLLPQKTTVKFSNEEMLRFGTKENAEYMYTLLSGLKQLVKWFDYLKIENVYDNTRIIVVSDHGASYNNRFDESGMRNYNPLFMVKDFEKRGDLVIYEEFMTHSDTPYLAAARLINAEKTDPAIAERKKNGAIFAFSAVSSQPLRHGPSKYNLIGQRELKVKEVFRKESWGAWERF